MWLIVGYVAVSFLNRPICLSCTLDLDVERNCFPVNYIFLLTYWFLYFFMLFFFFFFFFTIMFDFPELYLLYAGLISLSFSLSMALLLKWEFETHIFLFIILFAFSQVILVQVNPGEAFTIRREDGQFQCITGKKKHWSF